MKPLMDKQSFIGLENCTWLYNGAETPPHRGVMQAMQDYVMARSLGPQGRDRHYAEEEQCRANIAKLLNGNKEDIALVSNASEAITAIASALRLQAGDNVVIHTLEFPSGVYPWLLLQEQGVEVRKIDHRDWRVSAEDLLNAVDHRTKLVVTSHVSYVSGARLDYRKLYRELQATQAYLLLDVTQSLGMMPVHMYEADFVVCSSYKWLLSVHGLGILGINPRRQRELNPVSAGWRGVKDIFASDRYDALQFVTDARRFELGYPSYPTIYALRYTSGLLLDIGAEQIERYISEQAGYLIGELQSRGYEVMTPTEPEYRAGNIAFVSEQGQDVAEELLRHHVYVWGGDGRVRASIHLFNDREDIDRFVHYLTKT